jgi:23S rRNA pseudouridine955/2504/2580 synthase
MSKTNDDNTVRQFIVGADDDGVRLDRWFKRNLPQVGFATISRWARTGQIRVDGSRADPADRLSTGQILRVPPGGATPATAAAKTKPARKIVELTDEQRAEAKAMLMVETPSAFVLNKPPGLATQGGSGTTRHVDMLLDAYAGETEPRPRLVHRLDKDTSGVLLIARTPGSAAFFSKRFSGRTARKIYWALVVGSPAADEGLIELPLAKQPGTGGEKMMVDHTEEGQRAATKYRVIDRAGDSAAWLELQPLTGRTHQLRVHLAAIGHPIVGDGKYGGQAAFLTGFVSRKMHLHARRLRIEAPGHGQIDATAPLPDHFSASMEQLGFVEAEGNAPIDDGPPPPDKTQLKQEAKAHAKLYRKERRGERRKRADAPAFDEKSPAMARRVPAKAAGKPGAKPGAKPGPKAAAGTPARAVRSRARPAAPTAPRSAPKSGPKPGPKPGPKTGPRTGPKPGPGTGPRGRAPR